MIEQMMVLMNDAGEIIAAARMQTDANQEVRSYITPRRGEKLYAVSVSEEIADYMERYKGDAFQKAITKHFESEDTERTLLTAESHPFLFRSSESKIKDD